MTAQLATLVDQQDVTAQAAEQNAFDTLDNTEKGQKEMKRAIVSAQNIRRWKWWILLVVVLIIALIVGLIVWKVKEG
jgi:syntaxin 1B/2/3